MKKFRQAIAFWGILCICISSISATALNVTPRGWSQILYTTYGFGLEEDGKLTVGGSTTGNQDSTKVTVEVYVERQKTGGWTAVPGMSWSASSTSDTYVSINKTRYVDKGYSYRLRVEHSATGANGTEYSTTYSDVYYLG